MTISIRGFVALSLLSLLTSSLAATLPAQDVAPGDIYREYVWRPNTNWARCTGEDATDSGAKAFLPNPVNYIDLKDLKDATRVEVIVEKLMSHAGTNFPRIRVNRNAWIPIPEPDKNVIPGKIGEGQLAPYWFLTMRYPVISIPISQLVQGTNSFEFKCQGSGGVDLGRIWPQFIYYGVTFRVYYNATKPHPVGFITAPKPGSSLGWNSPNSIQFEAAVGHTNNVAVRKVDFIGNYNDFDWRGDGIDHQFKFRYAYGQIKRHIGTANVSGNKASVFWDATWIPQQDEAFSVVARVTDANGITYVTPIVNGLELRRQFTVKRYRNTWIPKKWQTRYHTPDHKSYTTVNDDVTKATKARLYMATWNGYEAEGIGINGRQMTRNIGYNHDLKYDTLDIPAGVVIKGQNSLYTHSTTLHHGIEVQWPGIELFMMYNYAETKASLGRYGFACQGAGGWPEINSPTAAILGRSFTTELKNAKSNSGAGLLGGFSNARFGPFDLPLSLTGAGAPGCMLLNSADFVTATVTDGAGKATLSTTIPNDRRLLGAVIFHQWLVADASNALKVVLSDGLRVSLGDY